MAFSPTSLTVSTTADRKKTKATNEQIMALRKEIASNPNMYNSNDPNVVSKWEELKNKLNAIGTEKTVSQWKKSWKDQEKHVFVPQNVLANQGFKQGIINPLQNSIPSTSFVRNNGYAPNSTVTSTMVLPPHNTVKYNEQSLVHFSPQHTTDGDVQARKKPLLKQVHSTNVQYSFKKPANSLLVPTTVANPLKIIRQPQMASYSNFEDNNTSDYDQVPLSKEKIQQSPEEIVLSDDESSETEYLPMTQDPPIKQEPAIKGYSSTNEWNLPDIPQHLPKKLKFERENNYTKEENIECVGFSLNVASQAETEEAKNLAIAPYHTYIKNTPAQNTLAAISAMDQHNILLSNVQESMDKLTKSLDKRSEEEMLYQGTVLSVLQEISLDLKKLLEVCGGAD